MNPDTVRFSIENPTRPFLFTEPECDARDVTYGVTVNYTNSMINATSLKAMFGFRDPITGLNLDMRINENDTLIYYIVGHGSTGTILCKDDYLFYEDIIEALEKFIKTHYYLHIYFIIDTCKSGSLFDHAQFSDSIFLQRFNESYTHDINVISGADASHNTYAAHCEFDSILSRYRPKSTCLTDEFSKQWMDFIQFGNENDTMSDLFNYAKSHTLRSPVTSYGQWDEAAWNRTVRDVFGIGDYVENIDLSNPMYFKCLNNPLNRRLKSESDITLQKSEQRMNLLNSYIKKHPDIMKGFTEELSRLKNLELRSKALSGDEKVKFTTLYEKEKQMISSISVWEKKLRQKYNTVQFEDATVKDWTCFRRLVKDFDAHFGHSHFGMNRFNYLATLCNMDSTIELEW